MAKNERTSRKARKDKKGRLLQKGEYQDESGRYEYTYTGLDGARGKVYSWRLIDTDKTPKGKKECMPLRRMEQQIARELAAGMDAKKAKQHTVAQLYEARMSTAPLKASTIATYTSTYDTYIKDELGNRKIGDITRGDIKDYYSRLLKSGKKINVIKSIDTVLHPIFKLAQDKEIILRNPTDGVVKELQKTKKAKKRKKKALTEEEQEALVEFVKQSKVYRKWMPLLTTLLGTGMRIGEAAGLQWDDIDFQGETISISHNLLYLKSQTEGRYVLCMQTPKTTESVRVIDMLPEVKEALLAVKRKQDQEGACESLIYDAEGKTYHDFVFINARRHPLTDSAVDSALRNIVAAYNRQADKSITLPKISAHSARHTFCTRYCENEANIKLVQEIMGHADARMTMEIYNDATVKKKRESMHALHGKMKIS